MRKSIVVLLVIAAVVVLISPGIIGRIAEQSVDSNLQWAADEREGISVTAERFDRSWFSSHGRHRVEIHDPELRDALATLAGRDPYDGDPTLIIDTRIDHGLIPVTSVGRVEGSLAPGLGRGVSTLVIEYPDGTSIPVPGTIYSSIGLSGVLTANYIVEPGKLEADGGMASWGAANVEISMDQTNHSVVFDGAIEALVVSDAADTLRLGNTRFSGVQRPSRFDLSMGNFEFSAESVAIEELGTETYRVGPVALSGSSDVDGNRVNGDIRMSIDALPVPGYGDSDFAVAMRFTGLDGAALGHMMSTLDNAGDDAGAEEIRLLLQDDVGKLAAAGFELSVEQFDFTLPQGPVALKMRFDVEESGSADFDLSSLLMTLDAVADLTASASFVDHAMATNPDAGAIIGMGYLRRNGDVYEMHAEYAKGLLTINGAPMPIPVGGGPPPIVD